LIGLTPNGALYEPASGGFPRHVEKEGGVFTRINVPLAAQQGAASRCVWHRSLRR